MFKNHSGNATEYILVLVISIILWVVIKQVSQTTGIKYQDILNLL